MKIIAGLGYDDRLPNHLPEHYNSLLCGEQGLITELEFRAGVVSPEGSQAARTVAYLKALKIADEGKRFYSQSLHVDPMASAESLLAWRDWAILHGWQHDSRSADKGRMADLAAVEEGFESIGSSLGERIYALLPRLNLLASGVTSLELHHPRFSWPALYQHLFDCLESAGVSVTEVCMAISPQAPADSDLGKLQRALSGEYQGALGLQQDGTLKLFSAGSEQLAAEYAIREANDATLIISRGGHHCLAAAIGQLGGNNAGLGDLSTFRAPNQLLLLMLQCAWQTPSAEVLLQYLSLPAGRFGRLRRTLARRFRDLPGFDRNHWQSEIDEFVAATLADDPEQDEASLRSAIDEWLPICLCPSDDAMSIELAVSLTDRVAKYWNAMLSISEQEQAITIFSAAYAAADAVSQALREWPESDISKIQLNRLITMVLSVGNSRLRGSRETSCFDVVSNAEVTQLRTRSISKITWINPEVSNLIEVPPLSQEELSGIPLAPDPSQQAILKQQALARSHAPLLAAEQSLTLIATHSNPELLKLQIGSLVDADTWPPLEDAILCNEGIGASAQPVNDTPLPEAQRWWSLDCPIPVPRSVESYSSLATLALKPHEYVLKYAAQIREGSIESLSADVRLKGNLAHHLIEAWINQHPWTGQPIARSDISAWLDSQLPVMIRQIALPLAQPGMQVEQLKFQQQMLEAMDRLLQAMVAAKVIRVEPECQLEYDDKLGKLVGTMDIFCEFDDGRFAIIDLKWGGYNRYREELKAGRPLQLATYAHIAEGNGIRALADAGYFILSRAELLCNSALLFPTATVVEPEDPTSLKHTWQQFDAVLRWRIEQLNAGQIEVTYGCAAPDDDSTPPNDTVDLVSMEDSARKSGNRSFKATYKTVDTWRNLTDNIKEH
ncbi:PD-(D/E)XK nuclease family protein [Motilimonas eburnea]|uniref:PD-(D/E)XK nuclease family protein n=1 Tax=Motilimonas eburnea TaxID=1737488 RepID=UPI001E58741C|nr:PD-(D/E)XK nuclease family protein [Motilimonas eburnea]MCE2570549.1 PD-(D/E)XK nuclease family protein [Motilimonas eburnea]